MGYIITRKFVTFRIIWRDLVNIIWGSDHIADKSSICDAEGREVAQSASVALAAARMR